MKKLFVIGLLAMLASCAPTKKVYIIILPETNKKEVKEERTNRFTKSFEEANDKFDKLREISREAAQT